MSIPNPSAVQTQPDFEPPRKHARHTRTWKTEEMRIARMLGSRRTPLSGMAGQITSADVLPIGAGKDWFVESKQRKKLPFWEVFVKVKKLAAKENRIPVLVVHQTGAHDRIAMLSFNDFVELCRKAGYIGEEE